MIEPPQFSNIASINDFINSCMRTTGIVPVGLKGSTVESANRWMASHWNLYFAIEQQEAILSDFMTRRLTK
jgi:hypothetical protein